MSLQQVDTIVKNYHFDGSMLLDMMQDIQKENNYLPKEDLLYLSEKINVPVTRIYGIASFYKSFSLTPGLHLIKVCLGAPCSNIDAPGILDVLERRLNIKAGETTDDNLFTLEAVSCLGICGEGPVVVIDNEINGKMTVSKSASLLEKYQDS